jgi:hypothetical protein
MLVVMYLLTRSAFRVKFEWWRLAHLVLVMGGLAALGELLLPTTGAAGFFSRAVVFALIPVVLWLTGFVQPREKRRVRALVSRALSSRGVREPA